MPLLLGSEEHTSELQSPCNLVCRLLLEKKKETEQVQPRRRVVQHASLRALVAAGSVDAQRCQCAGGARCWRIPLSFPPSLFFFLMMRRPPRSSLFPYTPLFR